MTKCDFNLTSWKWRSYLCSCLYHRVRTQLSSIVFTIWQTAAEVLNFTKGSSDTEKTLSLHKLISYKGASLAWQVFYFPFCCHFAPETCNNSISDWLPESTERWFCCQHIFFSFLAWIMWQQSETGLNNNYSRYAESKSINCTVGTNIRYTVWLTTSVHYINTKFRCVNWEIAISQSEYIYESQPLDAIETAKSSNQYNQLLHENWRPSTIAARGHDASSKIPVCIQASQHKRTLSLALIHRHIQPLVNAATRVMAPGLLLNTD